MNKIIQGDCLVEMEKIPDQSIDCVICDLPYGNTNCKWDIIIPLDKLWKHYHRITKFNSAIILFGQEPFSSVLRLSNLENYKYDWYWKKERLTNVFQVKRRPGKVIETISVFYREQCKYNSQKTRYEGPLRTNKIKNGKLGKIIDNNESIPTEYKDDRTRNPIELLEFKRDILISNLHPTQKPLLLCEYLVKTYTDENDIILDNTCGSGTVCVAAKKLNRRFIGIESDQKYVDISNNRLSQN